MQEKYYELFAILEKVAAGSIIANLDFGFSVISTSRTYNVPPDLVSSLVILVGAGGGGGGAGGRFSENNPYSAGHGGAAGGIAIGVFSRDQLGEQVPIVLGDGGVGGGVNRNSVPTSETLDTTGETGGTSSFGSFITATGGEGGTRSTSATGRSYIKYVSRGGIGVGGDLNINGSNGYFPSASTSGGRVTGSGGNSIFGQGGQPVFFGSSPFPSPIAGNSALGYGGGGGGGLGNSSNYRLGGDGADGVCVICEFLGVPR